MLRGAEAVFCGDKGGEDEDAEAAAAAAAAAAAVAEVAVDGVACLFGWG